MGNNNTGTAGTSQDEQRRVLGLLRSLLDDDRTRARRDWAALAPADEDDACGLLNAALVLLLQVTADPRLGGRDEAIAKLMRLSLLFENKYGLQ